MNKVFPTTWDWPEVAWFSTELNEYLPLLAAGVVNIAYTYICYNIYNIIYICYTIAYISIFGEILYYLFIVYH